MKMDNALNIKVDDRLLGNINRNMNDLDVSLSELIRACIEIGLPIISHHPDLIKILPLRSSLSIK